MKEQDDWEMQSNNNPSHGKWNYIFLKNMIFGKFQPACILMPGFLAQLFSCNTFTSVAVSICQILKIVIHLLVTPRVCLHFHRPLGLVLILDAKGKNCTCYISFTLHRTGTGGRSLSLSQTSLNISALRIYCMLCNILASIDLNHIPSPVPSPVQCDYTIDYPRSFGCHKRITALNNKYSNNPF